LVAAAKFLVAATKKKFVPNFVAVTKPFFPRDVAYFLVVVTTTEVSGIRLGDLFVC